jgi:hypothetical protein
MARIGRGFPLNRWFPRRPSVLGVPGPITRRTLAANTADSGASSVTTLQVTPTGQVEGDWMLAFVATVGGANTITSASGWVEVGTQVTHATTTTGSLWKKECGAGEAGPYQWDGASSRRMGIIVVAYTGADPTDLVDGANVASAGATAQQFDHGTLTPGAAFDWHILATCSNSATPDDDAVAFTQPAGYAEQAEISSEHATSANVRMALADRELPDTSATGTQSVTITGGVSRSLVGLEVVIRVPTGAVPGGPAIGPQRTSGASAGAKGTAGATQGASRVSGQAVGAKTAAGAASGAARTTGRVVSGRVATAAASGQQHTSGTTTGRKQAAGATTGATRSSGTTTGVKGAAGAQIGQQRTDGLAGFAPAGPSGAQTGQQRTTGSTAGAKTTAGVVSGRTRTSGTTTGRKLTAGASAGAQRSSGQSAAAKQSTGTASGQQRTTSNVVSALFVGPNGPARGQQRTSGRTTGIKGGVAAEAGQQHASGATAGIHRAVGAASGRQRTTGQTAAAKGARGAAVGQQRTDGHAAFTTVPPPRWVEGGGGGSDQIEGATSGAGQIEGVLVGAGLVEGAGGI